MDSACYKHLALAERTNRAEQTVRTTRAERIVRGANEIAQSKQFAQLAHNTHGDNSRRRTGATSDATNNSDEANSSAREQLTRSY